MFKIFMNDGSDVFPKNNIFYIVAKNGIFIRRKNELSDSISKVDKISILQDIEQYAKLNINKIKAVDFKSVVEFFKAVYEEHRTEATVKLYYNIKSGKYKILVPKQKVSAAGIKYENEPLEKDYSNFVLLGTIHSHGSMGAFHSAVDQSDEKDLDGLHITVGNVNGDTFTLSVSIMENGNRFMVSPFDYIYGLRKIIDDKDTKKWRYQIIAREMTPKFNPVWMDNVEKEQTTVLSPLYSGYGGGYGGYGKRDYYTYMSPKIQEKIKRQSGNLQIVQENPCKNCIFKSFSLDLDPEDLLDDDDLKNNWVPDVEYFL